MAISTGQLHIINVGNVRDYSPDDAYADAGCTVRPFLLAGKFDQGIYETRYSVHYAPTTPEGFAAADFDCMVMTADGRLCGGTYDVFFPGQATVTFHLDPGVQFVDIPGRPARYDAAANETGFRLIVPPGVHYVYLKFRDTKRQPGDTEPGGTGIGRLEIMRPTTQEGPTPHARGTKFSQKFLEAVGVADGLRVNPDWMSLNYPPTDAENPYAPPDYVNHEAIPLDSANRTRPGHQIQSGPLGACLEDAIALCNQLECHFYGGVHYNATEAYAEDFLNILVHGSAEDGTPYTEPQDDPYHPPLNPNLRAYLAWGNEPWNGSFPHYTANVRAGSAVPAGHGINWDDSDGHTLGLRYQISRTVELSRRARRIAGDAAMGSRIRMLLCCQQDDAGPAKVADALGFLDRYYNNADGREHVEDPHPPSYWVSGVEVGFYRWYVEDALDGSVSAQDVYDSGLAPTALAAQVAVAKSYGVALTGYEGAAAPNLFPPPGFVYELTAPTDPRAATSLRQILREAQADGLEAIATYTTNQAPWSIFNDVYHLDVPKYQAWRSMLRRAGPVEAIAMSIPDFVDRTVPVPNGVHAAGDPLLNAYDRYDRGGYVTVEVPGVQDDEGDSLELRLDGVAVAAGSLIRTVLVLPGNTSAQYSLGLTAFVPAGDHALSVVATQDVRVGYGWQARLAFTAGEPTTAEIESKTFTVIRPSFTGDVTPPAVDHGAEFGLETTAREVYQALVVLDGYTVGILFNSFVIKDKAGTNVASINLNYGGDGLNVPSCTVGAERRGTTIVGRLNGYEVLHVEDAAPEDPAPANYSIAAFGPFDAATRTPTFRQYTLGRAFATPVVTPATASLAGGESAGFSAQVPVTWSTSAGTITGGGTLMAPAATSSPQAVTVTATSTDDPTKVGTATVTVAAGSTGGVGGGLTAEQVTAIVAEAVEALEARLRADPLPAAVPAPPSPADNAAAVWSFTGRTLATFPFRVQLAGNGLDQVQVDGVNARQALAICYAGAAGVVLGPGAETGTGPFTVTVGGAQRLSGTMAADSRTAVDVHPPA